MNFDGQVVGDSKTADGSIHAFLSGQNGSGFLDLGTLPGGTTSHGLGVNDSGYAVGSAATANGLSHAFLFANGVMTDLNSLLPFNARYTLLSATSISNNGYITGVGSGGAFLLTPSNPVPEASSLVTLGLLLTIGIGGLMVVCRKRTA